MTITTQAINLINNFAPFSGPLFVTLEGYEALMQQAEQYISGFSAEVLQEANRLINRTYRLNTQRKFPVDTFKHVLLEGAILDVIDQ